MGAVQANAAAVAIIDSGFQGDGVEFCKRLLENFPHFPVILTGPNDEELITTALAAGADDYLALPLRPAEVVARVRAVLRRAPRPTGRRELTHGVLEVGDVRLDPESFEVFVRGQRLRLRLREFELLRLLMANAGIVLPRATLLSKLWGSTSLEGTTLDVHVRRLRSKLEEEPGRPKRIVTIRGIGYKYQPSSRTSSGSP